MDKLNKSGDFNVHAVKDAYVYGYPIVGMYELLYSQVIDSKTGTRGFQKFTHTAAASTPKTTFVPAPNNDTTYSRAWIDLRNGPVILSVPDTDNRFYSVQFLDLYSETIQNIGKRTTGTKSGKFLIIGPDWNGNLPSDCIQIKSNTTFVLAFLRILINDSSDLEEIKLLQEQFQLTPLQTQDNIKNPEKLIPCDTSNDLCFFKTLDFVLSLTPCLKGEEEIRNLIHLISQLCEKDIELECHAAKEEIDKLGMQFGEQHNHWRIARKGIGNYGSDYMQRSVVWHKGALANQPQESLYPSVFQDSDGSLLEGKYTYQLHFPKNLLPPVSQFWSLTMYIYENGFLNDNPIDRYSIGDRTNGIIYGEDGSLTITVQHTEPESSVEKFNWLPSPAGEFYLTLRLYGPSQAAIDGNWNPPAIQKI